MKRLSEILLLTLYCAAITLFMYCNRDKKDSPTVLSQTTDNRGLISVIFKDGKDTFALDYLTLHEYDSIFKPVSVEYFKQGQVLYPDYACSDTLIVRDAAGLNKAMAFVEQNIDWGTDADCDSLIHVYCDYYIGSFEDQFSKLKALQPTWDSLKIVTAINED